MPLQQWFAIAALGCLPLAAAAQQEPLIRAPADANAPAVMLRYESAFTNYRVDGDESQAPDAIWCLANAEVQGQGGQTGHMKGHMMQEGTAAATPMAAKAHDHAPHTDHGLGWEAQ